MMERTDQHVTMGHFEALFWRVGKNILKFYCSNFLD